MSDDGFPPLPERASLRLKEIARRHALPGLRVTTAFAPEGMDFNDVLRAGS